MGKRDGSSLRHGGKDRAALPPAACERGSTSRSCASSAALCLPEIAPCTLQRSMQACLSKPLHPCVQLPGPRQHRPVAVAQGRSALEARRFGCPQTHTPACEPIGARCCHPPHGVPAVPPKLPACTVTPLISPDNWPGKAKLLSPAMPVHGGATGDLKFKRPTNKSPVVAYEPDPWAPRESRGPHREKAGPGVRSPGSSAFLPVEMAQTEP